MGERNTKIRFSAQVAEYIAGVEKMASKTREAGSEAEKLAQKKEAFNLLGRTALGFGVALAAGLTVAIAKAADFDQAMSQVQAATHASAADMALLRQAALDAGASTVFTATEAANGIEELSKAGLNAQQVLGGGLKGALDLAAAGGLSVAEAAQNTATALKQFGLDGSKASHVADLLAAGAGKAVGDVSDLTMALNQSGVVANSTGLTIEETTGTLSAFADAGLLGSDAGTAFKTMLQRLTPSSAEAKAEMTRLGISAYDAQGQFIGISKFAGVLQAALKNLTPEQRSASQAIIFGSDAVRASTVLYDEGAAGIQKYIDQTNDAGYAAETAAIRLDNLKGDVEALGGALDTALIQSGSGANDVLRDIVQSLTSLVDSFNDLPLPVQQSILGIAGFTAGASILAGAAGIGITKLADLRVAFQVLSEMMPGTAKAISSVASVLTGPWGLAIAAATVVGLQFMQISSDQQQAVDDLSASLDENTGAFTKNTRQLVVNQLEADGTFNLARKAGIGLDLATDAALGNADALEQVDQMAKVYAATVKDGDFDILGDINQDEYEDLKNRLLGQNDVLKDAQKEWRNNQEAMGEAGEAADGTASELEQVSAATEQASDDLADLADQIRNFGKETLDTRDATRQYEQAIDDIAKAMGEEGWTASLDDTTQAGRDNNEMLDGLVSSTLELSASIIAQTGDTEAARAAMANGRQEFVNTATQMGLTADAANALADQVGLIPTNVVTNVTLTGTESMTQRIQSIVSFWESRGINIPVYTIRQDDAAAARGPDGNANGGMYAYANGGFGEGIYSGRPGALYKFAEPEVGWEAFISGKPGMEDRNRGIALEALSRLGGVPAPPSSAVTVVENTGPMYFTGQLVTDSGYVQGIVQGELVRAESARNLDLSTGAQKGSL
ncbi:MAG: phage tail tape measure protein [Herbiconiux sp.]|uniref:phage tail tape measure protein n=1 Tax=Herbiconiux sp. TaxID=1871186 RepID=UPI0012001CD1|nr:phage tail tape measure protein [Herbiconiux sp.]TAJ46363.1 MAG: phage tail tape measure protein [Herbiconiux sp.]